jgi:hypothetical protein
MNRTLTPEIVARKFRIRHMKTAAARIRTSDICNFHLPISITARTGAIASLLTPINQSINLVLFALHETPLCNPVHTDKHTLSRRHLRKHQTLPLVQRLPSQTRFWENLPIPSMKRF